ncbi:MAG TPA: response regulator [Candidatus Binatia bacterium]|nr:response regulator [Candidatus Binatia bacterium]
MPNKKRILIVDDNEEITRMFSTFLNARNFVTEIVNNGEKALATTLVFKPDIILLDIMMPKVNGFDVLDILKNTANTSSIPVLVLTSLGSKEDRDKAKGLGAEGYLEKSTVDLETILAKVNELLKFS